MALNVRICWDRVGLTWLYLALRGWVDTLDHGVGLLTRSHMVLNLFRLKIPLDRLETPPPTHLLAFTLFLPTEKLIELFSLRQRTQKDYNSGTQFKTSGFIL